MGKKVLLCIWDNGFRERKPTRNSATTGAPRPHPNRLRGSTMHRTSFVDRHLDLRPGRGGVVALDRGQGALDTGDVPEGGGSQRFGPGQDPAMRPLDLWLAGCVPPWLHWQAGLAWCRHRRRVDGPREGRAIACATGQGRQRLLCPPIVAAGSPSPSAAHSSREDWVRFQEQARCRRHLAHGLLRQPLSASSPPAEPDSRAEASCRPPP